MSDTEVSSYVNEMSALICVKCQNFVQNFRGLIERSHSNFNPPSDIWGLIHKRRQTRHETGELIIERSNQQCSTEQTQTHIHTLAAAKLTAVLYSGCSNRYLLAQKSKYSFPNAFNAEHIIKAQTTHKL